METITPITIDDDVFLASNVPENDEQEWSAGTAYATGDTVQVTTAVADVHKIYQCLVAQSAGLPADILNEDCADLTGWTDGDTGSGVSEVSPVGQYKFSVPTAGLAFPAYYVASRSFAGISAPPNQHTIEIKTYCDLIGSEANGDGLIVQYDKYGWTFMALFASDGLYLWNGSAWVEVGSNIVKSGASAAWQTWRFQIDKTTESSTTIGVYLKEEGASYALQGSVTYDLRSAAPGTRFLAFLCGAVLDGQIAHVDFIKIATGLGALANTDNSPVGNSNWLELESTNRWKAFNGILGSQTEQATKVEHILLTGETIDSLALMNLDSDTVDIIMIDDADDLVTNGEDWTGASGTTQPTGWDKVGTPTTFLRPDGTISIETDAAGEGISQTITVLAETEYQLIGKYYADSANINQYAVYDVTHSAYIKSVTDLDFTAHQWLALSHVFTTPAGCTSIKIELLCKNTGYIAWDSIKLAPTEYSESVTTGASKLNLVKTDLPDLGATGIITVDVNKSGTAKIGEIILGNKYDIGKLKYGPVVQTRNLSTMEEDAWGYMNIVERGYKKQLKAQLIIDNAYLDAIDRYLDEHLNDMLVWIGDADYSILIFYGYCWDHATTIHSLTQSLCALEVRGVI